LGKVLVAGKGAGETGFGLMTPIGAGAAASGFGAEGLLSIGPFGGGVLRLSLAGAGTCLVFEATGLVPGLATVLADALAGAFAGALVALAAGLLDALVDFAGFAAALGFGAALRGAALLAAALRAGAFLAGLLLTSTSLLAGERYTRFRCAAVGFPPRFGRADCSHVNVA
jgi:hypothetical protein